MDRIRGTGFNDDFFAHPSGSTIEGLGGNDQIFGNVGNDDLFGGAGDDVLFDNYGGSDRLYGSAGRDLLEIDRGYSLVGGPVVLDGGADDDTIRATNVEGWRSGMHTEAQIIGGSGNDQIFVNGISGTIDAGSGNDSIYSQYSSASIDAGAGNNFVSFYGQDGDDAVIGAGGGRDTVQVTLENADGTIRTGDGNDDVTLSMQRGVHQAHIDLGAGDDRASGEALTPDGFISVLGGAGNDTLSARATNVEARGGAGNDHMYVEAANSVIDAGSGLDTVTIGSEGDYSVVLGNGPDLLELDAAFTHSATTFDYVIVTDFKAGNSGDVLDLSGALAEVGWTPAQGDPFDAGYARLEQFAPDVASTFVYLSSGGSWFPEALLIGVSPSSLNAYNLNGFAP